MFAKRCLSSLTMGCAKALWLLGRGFPDVRPSGSVAAYKGHAGWALEAKIGQSSAPPNVFYSDFCLSAR
jgi:hypothetical protein